MFHAVFPTHVGVFLSQIEVLSVPVRLPHARGGVSTPSLAAACGLTSSPRTWGCFYNRDWR